MSEIKYIQEFCANPTKERYDKLSEYTQKFFQKACKYALLNKKGNIGLADRILKILYSSLEQIYLDTDQRVFLAANINKLLQGIKQIKLGQQCVNGAHKKLLNYISLPKFLGRGTYGNVYKGCAPIPCNDKSYEFAVKLASINKTSLNKPFNPFNQLWHEYFILHDIVNPLVQQGICPNLPYLLDTFLCENCDFEFIIGGKTVRKKNPCIIFITELASGDLTNWFETKGLTEDMLFSALFQIMSGLHALQFYGQVENNDVKAPNVLVYKVKPGGCWRYNIHGRDYFIPNYGYLFIINDFGVSYSYSPQICYKSVNKNKGKSLGNRFAIIIDGEYSPIMYNKSYSFYDGSENAKKQAYWGTKVDNPSKELQMKQESIEKYRLRSDCTYIEVKKVSTSGTPVLLCGKSEDKILVDITLTEGQVNFLRKHNIPTDPKQKKFYEFPDIIPALEVRADTQDAIRSFLGGPRYSQPGLHEKPECVTPNMIKLLSPYLFNDKSEPSEGSFNPVFCARTYALSPEYDLAGYFIEDFFTKKYNQFTKRDPKMGIIATYNISPRP